MTDIPHRIPHDPQRAADEPDWTAHKAWAGAGISALVAGLTTLYACLDNNTVTGQEWVGIIIAVLGGFGITGGVVYQVPNRRRARRARRVAGWYPRS